MGRILGLPFLLMAFTVLAGTTSGTAPGVRGIVQNPDGIPLSEVTVCLYEYDVPAFSPAFRRSHTTTDGAGEFTLEAGNAGDALLLLRGDAGTGRVKVTVTEDDEILSLSYPVRTTIVLLHDNDLHFNFNHLDGFRARITEYREQYPNVFVLNAGDVFIRHPDRWPFPGEDGYVASASYMIETMNDIGYDAMTVGNHELDYIGDLTRGVLESAQFPLLGANIQITTEQLPNLEPFTILATEERYSVAVLGLSSYQKDGVASLDPVETAQTYRHLADEHDVFVALTHIGNSPDRRLADEFSVLDVIIGGHTHGLLETAQHIGDVLFARAGGPPGGHPVDATLPKYLGVVKIVLENGRIVEKSGHAETFTAVPSLPAPQEKIAPVP